MSKQKKDINRYTNMNSISPSGHSEMKLNYKADNSPLSNTHLQHSSDGSTISSASNNSTFHRSVRNQDSLSHRNFKGGRGGGGPLNFRGQIHLDKARINPRFEHSNRKIQEFLITHWKNFIRDYHIKEPSSVLGKNGWRRNHSPDIHPSKTSTSPMSTSFDSNLSSPVDVNTAPYITGPRGNAKRQANHMPSSPSPVTTPGNHHQQHGNSSYSNNTGSSKTSPMPSGSPHANSPAHWNNGTKKNYVPNGTNGHTNGHNNTNGYNSWEKNHHGKKNSHQYSPSQNNKNFTFENGTSHSPNHSATSPLNTPSSPALVSQKKETIPNIGSNGSVKSPSTTPSRNQAPSSPEKSVKDVVPDIAPKQVEQQQQQQSVSAASVTRSVREETRHSESCATNGNNKCSVINGSMQSVTSTNTENTSSSTTSYTSANKTRHQSASSNSLTALSSGGASIDRGDTPNTIEQYYTPEPPSSPSTNPGAQANTSSE